MPQSSYEQSFSCDNIELVPFQLLIQGGVLAGTPIITADGPKKIEDLTTEDILSSTTSHGGKGIPLLALAKEEYSTNSPKEEMLPSLPVCIKAAAIADGIPSQDIWVSPTLIVSIWGTLIPVYLLVNERSIYFDITKTTFTVYQIETASQSSISVAGLGAQTKPAPSDEDKITSRLASSNICAHYQQALARRSEFIKLSINQPFPSNPEPSPIIPPPEPDFFQPATIQNENTSAIAESPNKAVPTTSPPAMQSISPEPVARAVNPTPILALEDGTFILPLRKSGHDYFFRLLGQPEAVSIVTDAFFEDNEMNPSSPLPLLAIGRVLVWDKATTIPITTHLTSSDLEGWEAFDEHASSRKMHSGAVLPLPYKAHSPSIIMQASITFPD